MSTIDLAHVNAEFGRDAPALVKWALGLGQAPIVTTNLTTNVAGTVTINPTADLTMGKNYHIEIDVGAFVDQSNTAFAGITGSTTWNFTVPDPAIRVSICPAQSALRRAMKISCVSSEMSRPLARA